MVDVKNKGLRDPTSIFCKIFPMAESCKQFYILPIETINYGSNIHIYNFNSMLIVNYGELYH